MTAADWPRRSLVRLAVPLSVVLIVAIIVEVMQRGHPASIVVEVSLRLMAAIAAGGCALRAHRESGAARWAWATITVGVLLAIADISATHALLVPLSAVVIAGGVVTLAVLPHLPRLSVGFALDLLIVVGSAALVAGIIFGQSLLAPTLLAAAAMVVMVRSGYGGGPALRTLWPLAGALFVAAAGANHRETLDGDLGGSVLRLGLLVAAILLLIAADAEGERGDAPGMDVRREFGAVVVAVGAPALALICAFDGGALTLPPPGPAAVLGRTALAIAVLVRLAVAVFTTMHDRRVLDERVASATLQAVHSGAMFRDLVMHSSDVIMVVSPIGEITYLSPSIERILGHRPDETTGRLFVDLVPGDQRRSVNALLTEAARRHGSIFTLDVPVVCADGSFRATEIVVTSLVEHAEIRGLVLNLRDVTERRRLEDQLTVAAFHDPLTGLANRALFHDRVDMALAERAARTHVAVLFLDLNGFKAVNDTQGHAVGDQLLGVVGERLRTCVRPKDTVARLGGDEFAVLVAGVDADAVTSDIAERILATLAEPVLLDGRELHVGASIGVASTSSGGMTTDDLLRNADLAMYRAKGDRDRTIVRYESHMHDALLEQVALEDDLRQAITRGQMAVYFQPTVDLRTGWMVGAEALLRWFHPTRGLIAPEVFVPIAERCGLIGQIGVWVLNEAAREAAKWQGASNADTFTVAVNISGRQLVPGIVDEVADALRASGLAPSALVLEITESVLLHRTEDTLELLRSLKSLGISLAVDDFGTGYSSLSYLTRFPVDVLKIDRSFVDHLGDGTDLASTIVRLGQTMGLKTVAEGIQTSAQLQRLREMGCEYGQGYLFARPAPAGAITELLALREANGSPILPMNTSDSDTDSVPAQVAPAPRNGVTSDVSYTLAPPAADSRPRTVRFTGGAVPRSPSP